MFCSIDSKFKVMKHLLFYLRHIIYKNVTTLPESKRNRGNVTFYKNIRLKKLILFKKHGS